MDTCISTTFICWKHLAPSSVDAQEPQLHKEQGIASGLYPSFFCFQSFQLQSNLSIVKSHRMWNCFHYRQVSTIDKLKIVKNTLGGPEHFSLLAGFSLLTSFTNHKFDCSILHVTLFQWWIGSHLVARGSLTKWTISKMAVWPYPGNKQWVQLNRWTITGFTSAVNDECFLPLLYVTCSRVPDLYWIEIF